MTKLDVAKTVISFTVGVGTTKIVHGIVAHNTDPENIVDTVTITAAGVALGMMASRATRKFTDNAVEEVATWWKTNVTKTA